MSNPDREHIDRVVDAIAALPEAAQDRAMLDWLRWRDRESRAREERRATPSRASRYDSAIHDEYSLRRQTLPWRLRPIWGLAARILLVPCLLATGVGLGIGLSCVADRVGQLGREDHARVLAAELQRLEQDLGRSARQRAPRAERIDGAATRGACR
jgi:hypothetical protein